jgi:hypothetical protein
VLVNEDAKIFTVNYPSGGNNLDVGAEVMGDSLTYLKNKTHFKEARTEFYQLQ